VTTVTVRRKVCLVPCLVDHGVLQSINSKLHRCSLGQYSRSRPFMLAAAVDSATDDGKTEEFPQMAPPLFTGRILRRVGSMLGTPRVVVFGGYHVCTAPSLTTLSVLFATLRAAGSWKALTKCPVANHFGDGKVRLCERCACPPTTAR